jgi:hypothetical protein
MLEGDGQRVDHRKGGATPVRKEWAEQQQKTICVLLVVTVMPIFLA